MKNIVLYGMRWVGKTTIAKILAKHLNVVFFDLDECIINEIKEDIWSYVKKHNRNEFREKEHNALIKILKNKKDKVIALWWGTIIFEKNQKILLSNNTKLIYLTASIENIIERVTNDEKINVNRPSLSWKNNIKELKEIFLKREHIYKKFGNTTIENNSTINVCLKEITKQKMFLKMEI